jgi:hypothetical protein
VRRICGTQPTRCRSIWRRKWEVDADLPLLKMLGVVAFTEFGKPAEEVFR